MPYITSIERSDIKKGRREGLQKGRQEGILHEARQSLLDVLEARFGKVPAGLRERVKAIGDLSTLRRLRRQAVKVEDSEAFEQLLP